MKHHTIGALVLSAVCALSSLSLFGCGEPGEGAEKSTQFDESEIILSFSAMSDVHQQMNKTSYADMLKNAFDYTEELNGGALDLALIAGDLTEETWRQINDNYNEEYNGDIAMLKQTLEECLDLNRTPVFYCLGNHDTDPSVLGKEYMSNMPALFYDQLGESFFTADCEDSDPINGKRHAVVNGYHFLSVMPDEYWTLHGYSQETLDWIDGKLAEITANEPEKYVFVTAHPPIYGSVFVSYTTDWADLDLLSVLEKYPQVIYFSGHIHNVLQDEIQVSQNGSFTMLDCGSVKYTAMMNRITDSGGTFDNTVGTRIEDFSQGLFVQVDVNGNVRVTRCDYYQRNTIKQPWEFSYPRADKSHLLTYDNDRRMAQNTAPEFREGAQLTLVRTAEGVECTWDAAVDDDMVRYYRLIAYRIDGESKTKERTFNVATFTYLYDRAEDMPATMSYTAVLETDGEYVFECIPVDVWNAAGEAISATLD